MTCHTSVFEAVMMCAMRRVLDEYLWSLLESQLSGLRTGDDVNLCKAEGLNCIDRLKKESINGGTNAPLQTPSSPELSQWGNHTPAHLIIYTRKLSAAQPKPVASRTRNPNHHNPRASTSPPFHRFSNRVCKAED